jgi:NTP pyrophosphatase (non-canonical NTP hydrolase)
MQLDDYQAAARRTAIYDDRFRVVYPALGLASEAGEVCGKVKKVLRDRAGDFEKAPLAALQDELGDVLWYVAMLAADLGLSLEEIAVRNLDKLRSRSERAARRQRRPALIQSSGWSSTAAAPDAPLTNQQPAPPNIGACSAAGNRGRRLDRERVWPMWSRAPEHGNRARAAPAGPVDQALKGRQNRACGFSESRALPKHRLAAGARRRGRAARAWALCVGSRPDQRRARSSGDRRRHGDRSYVVPTDADYGYLGAGAADCQRFCSDEAARTAGRRRPGESAGSTVR